MDECIRVETSPWDGVRRSDIVAEKVDPNDAQRAGREHQFLAKIARLVKMRHEAGTSRGQP
eukprot:10986876-Ditylum_brightwellii.AAC.1